MAQRSERLQMLINESIGLIQKTERLALRYDPRGFYVAFSGGKDSIVLLWLFEHAGVKYHAEMQNTTIEHPELMKFVREHYVKTGRVRVHNPHNPDGTPKNIYQQIEKKGLPLRTRRWCCSEFKEFTAGSCVNATGIRQAESARRKKQNPTALKIVGGKTQIKEGEHGIIERVGKKRYWKHIDLFDMDQDMVVECVGGADNILFAPIFKWTDADIWELIHSEELPYCRLYDEGYRRIGCIICPMVSASTNREAFKKYPGVYKTFCKAQRRHMWQLEEQGKPSKFQNVEEFIDWWTSGKSVDEYLADKAMPKLFEE